MGATRSERLVIIKNQSIYQLMDQNLPSLEVPRDAEFEQIIPRRGSFKKSSTSYKSINVVGSNQSILLNQNHIRSNVIQSTSNQQLESKYTISNKTNFWLKSMI